MHLHSNEFCFGCFQTGSLAAGEKREAEKGEREGEKKREKNENNVNTQIGWQGPEGQEQGLSSEACTSTEHDTATTTQMAKTTTQTIRLTISPLLLLERGAARELGVAGRLNAGHGRDEPGRQG